MLAYIFSAVCAVLRAITKLALVVERGGSTIHHAMGPVEAQAMSYSERGYLAAAAEMKQTLADAGVTVSDKDIEVYLRDGDMTGIRKAMALPAKPQLIVDDPSNKEPNHE